MPEESRTRPARQTRNRILEVTLALYNALGEPNVSTTLIATEVGISAGNLHYHFRKKDQLIGALLDQFVKEIEELLPPDNWRAADVEDAWFLLHVIFECIWKYRFLYRDLDDLLSRNRLLEVHFKQILAHKVKTAAALCEGLVATGEMQASRGELQALATNMAVIATYWLPFEYARDPRRRDAVNGLGRGVYQVMSMMAPFLQGTSRQLLQQLSKEYVTQ